MWLCRWGPLDCRALGRRQEVRVGRGRGETAVAATVRGAAAVWAAGLSQQDHVKGPEGSWAGQVRSTGNKVSGSCRSASVRLHKAHTSSVATL